MTLRKAAPALADLTPYDPRYLPARIYLNANENPNPMPPVVVEALKEALDKISGPLGFNRYPDPLANNLRQYLAEAFELETGHRISYQQILFGNGGDELIFDLVLAWGGAGRKLLIAPPCFSSYQISADLTATEIVKVSRKGDMTIDEAAVLDRLAKGDIDLVMLGSPNNPTGECLRSGFVRQVLQACDALVLIDQAYVQFSEPECDLRPLLAEYDNLVVLQTLSKAWGLAGLRLGLVYAAEQVIDELLKVRQAYSVDSFSVLAAQAVFDNWQLYVPMMVEIVEERKRLLVRLEGISGLEVFASEANFVLLRLKDAARIWQRLYDDFGILIRDFSSSEGLSGCLRVTVGRPEQNDELVAALSSLMAESES